MKSLSYIRVSRNPDQPGYEYMHHFGTGWQELIFTSHEAAARFAESEGITLNP